ncbi:MAG TPA: hypothetical protein V6D33_12470 [Cyanophyceae cyanobacterium]
MGRRRNRRKKQVRRRRLLYAGAGLAGVGALGTVAALGGRKKRGGSAVFRPSAAISNTFSPSPTNTSRAITQPTLTSVAPRRVDSVTTSNQVSAPPVTVSPQSTRKTRARLQPFKKPFIRAREALRQARRRVLNSALVRVKGSTRFYEDYVPAIERNVRLGARSGRKTKDWKAYVKANRGAYSLRNTNRFSRYGRMAYFRTLVTSPGAMVHVPRSSAGLARVSRPTLSGAQLINRTGTVRTTRYRQGGAIKARGVNPRMRKPIIKRAIVRPIRRKRFGFFDEGVETVRFNSPLLGEFSPCRY